MKTILLLFVLTLLSSCAIIRPPQTYYITSYGTSAPVCYPKERMTPERQGIFKTQIHAEVSVQLYEQCKETPEFIQATMSQADKKKKKDALGLYIIKEMGGHSFCTSDYNKTNPSPVRFKTDEECSASKELALINKQEREEEVRKELKASEEKVLADKAWLEKETHRQASITKIIKNNPTLKKFEQSVRRMNLQEGMPEALVKLSCGTPESVVKSQSGTNLFTHLTYSSSLCGKTITLLNGKVPFR